MGDETITESDIWADIDAAYQRSERQPGDIDAHQWAEHYGVSVCTARRDMAIPGIVPGWEYITIRVSGGNGKCNVLRKVK